MKCRITDLKCKEVVNVCTGARLGYVNDVLINAATGCVVAVIVPGPCKYWGIFGSEGDFIIPWDCIKRFGNDIILVEVDCEKCLEKRGRRHSRDSDTKI